MAPKMLFLLLSILTSGATIAYQFDHSSTSISPTETLINATLKLDPQQYLYKNSFQVAAYGPGVSITSRKTANKTESFFDPAYDTQKEGYAGTVIYEIQLTHPKDASEIPLHLTFQLSGIKEPQEKVITLNIAKQPSSASAALPVALSTVAPNARACVTGVPSASGGWVAESIESVKHVIKRIKDKLTGTFDTTGSLTVRLLIALFLGILLSLTPCIYPMIPITIGILQINSSKSTFKSFLMAGSYALGISLTFAAFGLIAALGGSVFGQLQTSPFFIIPLVALLVYFGLSMFGWYEIYIPRFMQPKNNVKGGTHLAAFIFGMITGTVASPCLSPGLFLLLNYVASSTQSASIFSYLEGFLLLFIFGFGSSLPLLIIGTFSGSMKVLPRAGMWMVEIKKIVGLMLLAAAFYQLSHLDRYIPLLLTSAVAVMTLCGLGVYYIFNVHRNDSRSMKWYKYLMGAFLIICGCLFTVNALRSLVMKNAPVNDCWKHTFAEAHEQSLKDKKYLFIDVGATYCGICKSLDKTVFSNPGVLEALNMYGALKIEADMQPEEFESINKLYGPIKGFPTYLIVDSEKNQLIKKFGAELGDLHIDEIVTMLQSSIKK